MLYLLPYLSDVYKELPNGKSKLVAKDVLRHRQIDMDLVDDVTEYINDRGKIVKNMSILTHKDLGQLVINMPCEELWELRKKQNGFEILGFRIELNDKNIKNGKRKTSQSRRSNSRNSKSNSRR